MATTLKDIAERVGVSVQAVSLALHKAPGTAPISAALRERIVETARDMEYHPNRLARALAQARSRCVGLLMLTPVDLPYANALRGVGDEGADADYGVLLCRADGQEAARRPLQTFVESRVEGIVAVATSRIGLADEVLARKPRTVPLVSINREVRAKGVLSIIMDNYGAMQGAVEHLIACGHQRIAYFDVGSDPSTSSLGAFEASRERLDGYLAAMGSAGFEPLVCSLPWWRPELRVAEANQIAHALLTGPEAPSAFCAATDYEALGALQACLALGVRVPEDVAVFGFDDCEAGQLMTPALSSVRQAFYAAGRLAVRRLLEWDDAMDGDVIRLDCQLVFRASTPQPL